MYMMSILECLTPIRVVNLCMFHKNETVFVNQIQAEYEETYYKKHHEIIPTTRHFESLLYDGAHDKSDIAYRASTAQHLATDNLSNKRPEHENITQIHA